jgi:hypothetical protein
MTIKVVMLIFLVAGDHHQTLVRGPYNSVANCEKEMKAEITGLSPAYRLTGMSVACLPVRSFHERKA